MPPMVGPDLTSIMRLGSVQNPGTVTAVDNEHSLALLERYSGSAAQPTQKHLPTCSSRHGVRVYH